MILYVQGDLFQSPAQVLVNTVNTVGVMGKGIALEFRRLFPEMFEQYRLLCEAKKIDIGTLWLYKTPNKWVLNFPTKRHWRDPSRVEYVEAGLKKFAAAYSNMGIHSIAFPPLGCGNGQLDFVTQVQPLMEKYLRNLPIDVFIYPDRKSEFIEHLDPKAKERWLRTEPQNMPFVEVWNDIGRLLATQSEFETIARRNKFTAQLVHEPRGIKVTAAGKIYLIPYDALQSFWQQLRVHGFSMRNIAPSIDRSIAYIIPIFARLNYVSPVNVAEDYNSPQSFSMIGLQVLPSAFSRVTHLPAFSAAVTVTFPTEGWGHTITVSCLRLSS
jgi:O-acetyl-ADP-ribose deacetylase (regulator of RNase III)